MYNSANTQIIKGYPMYRIDKQGNIYSSWRGKKLKPRTQNGYASTTLKKDETSKPKVEYIHRLLAKQFIDVPEHLKYYTGKLWVNHKDGNKLNNNLNNLEWTTISENIQHSYTTLKRKIYKGAEHWLTGTKASEETKQKQSEAKKGSKHPKYKGYYRTPAGIFYSTCDAAVPNNTYAKKVYRRCHSNKYKDWEFVPNS